MDRKLYTDDFERLLREKSDEFRMYPSKRIWNSIYNNIHPGKKWPSVAMSITLISALLLIGYLNSSNTLRSSYTENNTNISLVEKTQSRYQPFPEFAAIFSNPLTPGNSANSFFLPAPIIDSVSGIPAISKAGNGINGLAGSALLETKYSNGNRRSSSKLLQPANQLADQNKLKVNATYSQTDTRGNFNDITNGDGSILINETPGILSLTPELVTSTIEFAQPGDSKKPNIENLFDKGRVGILPAMLSSVQSVKIGDITTEDKAWVEDYAFHHKPVAKKWANKLGWQVYATPSVVYRKLYNHAKINSTLNSVPFANAGSSRDIDNEVTHRPSLGLEAGAALQYSLFKGLKLTAGLQFNYTRYNAIAFQNTHPVATKLALNDFRTNLTYEVYRNTSFSNKAGLSRTHIHNETYQVSIPLGVELKLAGKDNWQWNVATTIQPTYLAGDRSYLISSDRRNYVKESSMLNRWNMNAGFETFISYKHNGFTWQLGPHFRKQLFSTHSRLYTVEEKLVNYGLKVGISKIIL